MHKEKLEFSLMMADDALKQHFDANNNFCHEFEQLREYCRNLLTVENVHKIYAKLLKMRLNQMAVSAAVESLSPDKQKYLRLRYREEKGGVAISLALHVSAAQLNLWHRDILEYVAQFMLYTLRPEDVFLRQKVAAMVDLISETMDGFSLMDPEGAVITEEWMTALATRHAKYRLLLGSIDKILQQKDSSLHTRVVAYKLLHPTESSSHIAEACHVSVSVISRHLRDFSNEMASYFL